MTENQETGVDPKEQGTPALAATGFDKGHVTAWLRAHRLKNINVRDLRSSSVITDAKHGVNLRSVALVQEPRT